MTRKGIDHESYCESSEFNPTQTHYMWHIRNDKEPCEKARLERSQYLHKRKYGTLEGYGMTQEKVKVIEFEKKKFEETINQIEPGQATCTHCKLHPAEGYERHLCPESWLDDIKVEENVDQMKALCLHLKETVTPEEETGIRRRPKGYMVLDFNGKRVPAQGRIIDASLKDYNYWVNEQADILVPMTRYEVIKYATELVENYRKELADAS